MNKITGHIKRQLDLEQLTILGDTLLKGHRDTPEWTVVLEAMKHNEASVAAVGLEVIASHFEDDFSAPQQLVLHTLAAAIRQDTPEIVDTLVDLLGEGRGHARALRRRRRLARKIEEAA